MLPDVTGRRLRIKKRHRNEVEVGDAVLKTYGDKRSHCWNDGDKFVGH